MEAIMKLFWIVLILSALLGWITGTGLGGGFQILLGIIECCILAAVGYGAYRLFMRVRDPIARWYYFTFYPHPAESIVHNAITQGAAPLDGRSLAAALGEMPPHNSVFRAVRIEQGERLVSLMREASLARMRAQERADNVRAKHTLEEAAALDVQAAVGLAGVALERAKAQFEASRRIRI